MITHIFINIGLCSIHSVLRSGAALRRVLRRWGELLRRGQSSGVYFTSHRHPSRQELWLYKPQDQPFWHYVKIWVCVPLLNIPHAYINLIWSLDLIICDYIIEHISIHRQKRTSRKLLFRLCVWAVLNMKPNASLLVMAVVCSSWSRINVGTSRRSILLPEGWQKLQYVTTANSMMSRTHLGIVEISFRVSCFQYPTPLDETNIHGNGMNMKLQILNYTIIGDERRYLNCPTRQSVLKL